MYPTISEIVAPPLPAFFLLPATVLFALATAYWILQTRGRAARFLIFVCWFRYTLGSLHELTYQEAVPGLRWVAIGSLLSIAIGLVVLDKRRIFSKPFVPVAIIIGLMIVSAIINQGLLLAVDPILRFLFFVLTAVALWQALETHGSAVLRRLLFVFVQPMVFLAASLALGIAKSGELDGSISYIGGYLHEELFSLILVTGLLVAVLTSRVERWVRISVIVLSIVGIYLTQYRTSILAVIPMMLAVAFIAVPRAFRARQRLLVRIAVTSIGGILIVLAAFAVGPRFSELSAISDSRSLIKPPEAFSWEDQRVLSARPYIWSQYLYAYSDSPTLQKVIGHGPDSWEGRFPLYAHNTIISFLYELGVLGVGALLLLWLVMLRLALRADPPYRAVLVAGHASFVLLSMATMPQWQIEGNICYGLLCGYTIAKARFAGRANRNGEGRPTPAVRGLQPGLNRFG